jgi:hypothetical protein
MQHLLPFSAQLSKLSAVPEVRSGHLGNVASCALGISIA